MASECAVASEASRVGVGAAATGACIVTRGSSPMELVAGVAGLPAEGVLMHGRRATVFATAAAALRAVRRSWAHAERNSYDWGQQRSGQWQVWPLVQAAGRAAAGAHDTRAPDGSDA